MAVLRQYLYISTAEEGLTDGDIKDILEISVKNNEDYGISGFLIHHENMFMQVIEGEYDVIQHLVDNLRKDTRHTDMKMLLDIPIFTREFAYWIMGFKFPEEFPSLSSHPNVFPTKLLDYANPSDAIAMLKSFISIGEDIQGKKCAY